MSSIQFLIGKTLGKYEVLEHIGHGGMSEVYKGQQVQLDRMVAIKVLHPFLADEKGFVVRFQREARIVATLRHPNIVQVYDFDYHDELTIYYMVMEYIDGPTLKDLLEDEALPPEEAIRIGAAIAEALDYAHQRGMVHRDIKPANIMFIDAKQPVLTDFGIAKMVTLSGLTASGAMVGTPAYMAPEIGIGKPGTSLSDIYSLSVVLYQMVTGSLPFAAETPMAMVMDHINKPPPRPSLYAPDMPEALEEVILRGLAKEPQDRFSTGQEMARALRAVLDPSIVYQRPETLPNAESSEEPQTDPDVSEDEDFGGLFESPGAETDASSPPPTTGLERASVREAAAPFDSPSPNDDAFGNNLFDNDPSDDALIDDELMAETERLVKSWDPASSGNAEERARSVPTSSEQSRPGHARWPRVLLRNSVFLVLAIVIGTVIWFGIETVMPGKLQELFSVKAADLPAADTEPPPHTPLPTPSITPTPTPAPTKPLSFVLAASPTPTVACVYRAKLDQIRIEPDQLVAPGTPLVAYVALRNNGKCPWPDTVSLVFTGGDQLGDLEAFSIPGLAPDASAQVIMPMKAPEALGNYQSRWKLQWSEDEAFDLEIEIDIDVEDVPRLTPTPTELIVLDHPTPEPLTLPEPTLVSWDEDLTTGQWTGLLAFQAEGGTGTYRYYLEQIQESSELADGKLTLTAQRCAPLQIDLWVLSGDQILNWIGEVSYPAPDVCQ